MFRLRQASCAKIPLIKWNEQIEQTLFHRAYFHVLNSRCLSKAETQKGNEEIPGENGLVRQRCYVDFSCSIGLTVNEDGRFSIGDFVHRMIWTRKLVQQSRKSRIALEFLPYHFQTFQIITEIKMVMVQLGKHYQVDSYAFHSSEISISLFHVCWFSDFDSFPNVEQNLSVYLQVSCKIYYSPHFSTV